MQMKKTIFSGTPSGETLRSSFIFRSENKMAEAGDWNRRTQGLIMRSKSESFTAKWRAHRSGPTSCGMCEFHGMMHRHICVQYIYIINSLELIV